MDLDDGDGSDPNITNFMMRDEWIRKQLEKRINEFTDEKTLHIFLGTWNVNAKKDNCRLDAWLKPEIMQTPPDIYAIGMQEIVDLNASNVMRDPQTAEPWIQKFQSCLSDDYVLVNYKQLVGIVLCVFAKREHYPNHISKVLMASTGVGVMGIGNKGGIGVRFDLYDSSFCVLNSHLSAHQNNVPARNDNFRDITEKLKFSTPTERGLRGESYSIEQHDYVFWIGDLNYRIDVADMDIIFDRIIAQDLDYLLRYDQLSLERSNKNVFQQYSEGKISFPPTYKFQPNTNDYERRQEKKKRSPAWCDRILWRSRPGTTVQMFYDSASSLCISDHKPVMSMFKVAVKVLVAERRNEIYQSLVKQMDALENQQIPKITLSVSSIHFDSVRFDHRQNRIVKVSNDGEAIIQFQFAPIPDAASKAICKPWLNISPYFGIIPPGESVNIDISIHIQSKEVAFGLNACRSVLEDILIIKLLKGCDYFIPVSGNWLPSCLASSIEYLVSVPGAVRTTSAVPETVLSVPKEIWRLIDYIYQNGGLTSSDLFSTEGHTSETRKIFDDLDENVSFAESYSLIAVGRSLILLLTSLCRPVIPLQLFKAIRSHPDPIAYCRQCLLELPLSHYNVIIFIVSFLREVLANRQKNDFEIRELASVFGQALCQYPASADTISTSESPATVLMEYLLTSSAFS
uniref:Rho-GAP domain-containing protein n=2 Tax=Spongospora subterranea TaxID=70186 RepID=A0A0H5R6U5_9EUKA|eukprot:CRZ09477.1 hypothetical protein [Spongospora subterranea]